MHTYIKALYVGVELVRKGIEALLYLILMYETLDASYLYDAQIVK